MCDHRSRRAVAPRNKLQVLVDIVFTQDPAPVARGGEAPTCRYTRSPSAPVIDQDGQAVGRRRGPPRELEVAKWAGRPPNFQRLSGIRDNPCDRCAPIE